MLHRALIRARWVLTDKLIGRYEDTTDTEYGGGEQAQWSYQTADGSRMIVASRNMDTPGERAVTLWKFDPTAVSTINTGVTFGSGGGANTFVYVLRSLFTPTTGFSMIQNNVPTTVIPTFFTGAESLNLNYQMIDTNFGAIIVGSMLNDFIVLQGGAAVILSF